jgi:hypothetical protein
MYRPPRRRAHGHTLPWRSKTSPSLYVQNQKPNQGKQGKAKIYAFGSTSNPQESGDAQRRPAGWGTL